MNNEERMRLFQKSFNEYLGKFKLNLDSVKKEEFIEETKTERIITEFNDDDLDMELDAMWKELRKNIETKN